MRLVIFWGGRFANLCQENPQQGDYEKSGWKKVNTNYT